MSFTLGYNTNGFPHHRLEDAIDILAEIGYRSVGITLDYHHLNPFEQNLSTRVAEVRSRLDRHRMTCVIETGARFLLDPRRKHQPTLMDIEPAARKKRLEFLKLAVSIARDLNSNVVSIWSGVKPGGVSDDQASMQLLKAYADLLEFASQKSDQISIAWEPEPGMHIERLSQYESLRLRNFEPSFHLTLDIGHIHCLNDGDPAERIGEFAFDLRNVHIEDMRRGVHEHLMFGEGEMDFPPIFAALREVNYEGGVYVELSRHGHDAVNAAKKSFDFLSKL